MEGSKPEPEVELTMKPSGCSKGLCSSTCLSLLLFSKFIQQKAIDTKHHLMTIMLNEEDRRTLQWLAGGSVWHPHPKNAGRKL